MKKRVLLLLPLFLGACSDSGESPVITIEKLIVETNSEDGQNAEKVDYSKRMEEMPALKVGDKVNAILALDGNGAELKTFTFKLQDDEGDKELSTNLRYQESQVTTEGNLTDKDKGQLRFKDGVTQTKIMVEATVEHVDKNGDVRLAFYLSSKAECEGAEEEIGLKTTVDEKKE